MIETIITGGVTLLIAGGGLAVGYGLLKGKVIANASKIEANEKRLDRLEDSSSDHDKLIASMQETVKHLDRTVSQLNEGVANFNIIVGDIQTRLAVEEARSE